MLRGVFGQLFSFLEFHGGLYLEVRACSICFTERSEDAQWVNLFERSHERFLRLSLLLLRQERFNFRMSLFS